MALDDLLIGVKQIIIRAGQEVLKYYGTEYSHESKREEFPITKADSASDRAIISGLREISDCAILTEESRGSKRRLTEERLWLVDPLDGTKDFMEKNGEFCLMIALWEKGEITMGLVYQPTTAKLYWAVSGQGAFLEQDNQTNKLQVSEEKDLTKCKLLLSRHHLSEADKKFKDQSGLGLNQTWGSAGLKLALIAEGQAHLYFNASPNTGEWDIAAGSIIVSEAGGEVTDTRGQKLLFNKPEPFNRQGFMASNKINHQRFVEILKTCL